MGFVRLLFHGKRRAGLPLALPAGGKALPLGLIFRL
jgi:hypothetical protein